MGGEPNKIQGKRNPVMCTDLHDGLLSDLFSEKYLNSSLLNEKK